VTPFTTAIDAIFNNFKLVVAGLSNDEVDAMALRNIQTHLAKLNSACESESISLGERIILDDFANDLNKIDF